MVVSVNPKQFVSLFEDFVKTGKMMFNFDWNGTGLVVQAISDYTMVTEIECTLIDGPTIVEPISYYVNNSIHLFNNENEIIMEFKDGFADITQGPVKYTLIEQYEGKRELPFMVCREEDKLNVGRLQYLAITAKNMVPIAKELQKLPADIIFANGHFYNFYSNVVFVDEMDLPDACMPYEVLHNIALKLKKKDAKFAINKDVLLLSSDRYKFYVSLTNYNLQGNTMALVDKMILESRHISTISFSNVLGQVQLILSVLKNQEFTLSLSDKQFYLTVKSADDAANIALGTLINRPLATVYLTSAQVTVLMRLFGEEDTVEVYLCNNAIRFKAGTKNLLISVLVY